MSKVENKDNNSKLKKFIKKFNEMWHDKKGRAIIELCFYGIFIVGVIIFARALSAKNSELAKENPLNQSFMNLLSDNYEYNLNIAIDDDNYTYTGKILGNNGTITNSSDDNNSQYSIVDNKFYINEGGNLILTDENEVFSELSYRYLDIDNIKGYLSMGTLENDIYKISLSHLILYGSEDKYITIKVDEANTSVTIDYTELFKENDSAFEKVIVTYTFKNINKVISLDDKENTFTEKEQKIIDKIYDTFNNSNYFNIDSLESFKVVTIDNYGYYKSDESVKYIKVTFDLKCSDGTYSCDKLSNYASLNSGPESEDELFFFIKIDIDNVDNIEKIDDITTDTNSDWVEDHSRVQ